VDVAWTSAARPSPLSQQKKARAGEKQKPSDGIEPSTPSLPPASRRDLTTIRDLRVAVCGRAYVRISFAPPVYFSDNDPCFVPCARRPGSEPPSATGVLSLVYPPRTRGVLSVLKQKTMTRAARAAVRRSPRPLAGRSSEEHARWTRRSIFRRGRRGVATVRVMADATRAPQLMIVPAREAGWDDVRAVFGTRGDPWCQRFKTEPGEAWPSLGLDELRATTDGRSGDDRRHG
jgi:hypothetical protein